MRLRKDDRPELAPRPAVEASQAWFWSERWQGMEREADADIRAGRITRFNSAEEFLAELALSARRRYGTSKQ
jgi:hypothetical protein